MNRSQIRNAKANMLSMTALVIGILILACVVAFAFYLLLAEQKRGQTQTDEAAMEIAKSLNELDRVGQLNNVVARNREFVFVSRQALDMTQSKNYQQWVQLANYLCDEARASNQLVEKERKNQIELSKAEVRKIAFKKNMNARSDAVFRLPWWQSYDTQIFDVSCGAVDKVQSNVLNTDVYPDLREFDLAQKYFQKGSDLYMGGINAKLPSPDNDLTFKFAALAAPVQNTISPARLINTEAYKPFATIYVNRKFENRDMDQVPTAVEVSSHMDVSALNQDKTAVKVNSCAVCTGALPPP
ncbi:MAG: hypothetical protein ACRD3W_14020 [Terriglobales bacterium]